MVIPFLPQTQEVIKREGLLDELQVVCGREVVSADGLKFSTGIRLHTGGDIVTSNPQHLTERLALWRLNLTS